MNYVREYWERISSGEIVTSRRVKAVYGRLVAEMDAATESSPYYFDEAVGERPIIFVERFCKQSQGTLGESLTLELFQKAFIQLLFGWLERATGYRRFRETLFLVGRKNGKSTLLAALALYMLVADYEGAAEIYSVATKKDQAKKTLTEAVNMVKQSPELSAILKKRRNDIYFPATASKFEALASDSNTLDGLNSHAVIIDELHAIRDRNLYEVMKQSTSSRRQPLVIMITTSGTVRESVFDNLYGYACEVADGQTPDERFLPVLYELDKREEWTDPTAWIKANPGLGTIKQYTTLADFVERAKKNPEDLPGVLCKDFNVKATGAASWLSYEDAVNEATFKPEEVYNTYATVLWECDGVEYKEIIDRHAFDECDMSDVIFNYNHGGKVVARLRNKTLALNIDERGVNIDADLGGTTAGRELYEEIDGGYVDKMSFSFTVREASYDSVTHTRTITKVKKLYDVSAVDIPAYNDTSISARSFFEEEHSRELAALEQARRRKKLVALTY